jgi:hypothetical protein
VTLSTVAVATVADAREVTASPMKTLSSIGTVSVPTSTHDAPSADQNAEN